MAFRIIGKRTLKIVAVLKQLRVINLKGFVAPNDSLCHGKINKEEQRREDESLRNQVNLQFLENSHTKKQKKRSAIFTNYCQRKHKSSQQWSSRDTKLNKL